MKFHPVCEVFPKMSAEHFEALKADIAKHGVLQPVETFDGSIIDGRHRWLACQALGVNCPTREWKGREEEIVDHVTSLNKMRRHLSKSEWSAVAVDLEIVEAQLAAERQKRLGRTQTPLASNEAKGGKAAAIVADQVGVSRASVERAKQLKKLDPEEFEKAKQGEKSVSAGLRDAKKKVEAKKAAEKPADDFGRDEEGRAIPDAALAAVFARRVEFEALNREVHATKRKIEALAQEAIGCELHLNEIQGASKTVASNLLAAAPHAVCPYPSKDHKTCRMCEGRRWVKKSSWNAIPDDIREAAK